MGTVVSLESWVSGCVLVDFESPEANYHGSEPEHCKTESLRKIDEC